MEPLRTARMSPFPQALPYWSFAARRDQLQRDPFASTCQGAATGDGRFSRRMIDKTQNSRGGTALVNFYIYSRILNKDKFLVWIKP
ncbi:hypothetical protein ABT112_02200 [Streptomyces sp. NPDC002055]|uniref:NucA/NucB deoxyribonuclease domain-containing protein n=1 Tax=Streptomyces sp. NPDC002055 TaxID=3154534 RepID=UPI0033193ED4